MSLSANDYYTSFTATGGRARQGSTMTHEGQESPDTESGDDSVTPPNDRKRAASDEANERQLEKKRRSSREASRRARKKTKDLIYELSDQNAYLREDNATLRARLAASEAENARLKLMQEEEQLRVMERGRKLNAMMQQLQHQRAEQQQYSHRRYSLNPTISTAMHHSSFRSTHDVKAPPPPSPFQDPAALPFRARQVGMEMSNDPRDFLANQMKLQQLREETKGLRNFLARHSI